jgi:hypothetical protein
MEIEIYVKQSGEVPEKISTGIEEFDDPTGGGLPYGRTTLLMGGAFGWDTRDLEEPHDQLIEAAAEDQGI